jgi:hypothetical protein
LLGAITVMSSKGVSTGFRDAFAGNPVWFKSWLVYILILAMLGSIFFQMKYLNMAMIAFGSSQVLSLCLRVQPHLVLRLPMRPRQFPDLF